MSFFLVGFFLIMLADLIIVGVALDLHDARLRAALARCLRNVAATATRWEWS